jgi:MFS family permease
MNIRIRGITRNVVVLGIVALLTDMSTEMLYPLIPIFLTGSLGLPIQFVGFIEGIAEGISNGLRWLGGLLSDMTRRRKPFVFWGYLLSALSKPVMGLAAVGGWGVFLAGRSADRFGKSVRSAARDALIADSTDKQYRGVAFGFHSAMDTCGAIIGPLMAIAILVFWPGMSIAWLFLVALVPSLAASMVALAGIKDITHQASTQKAFTRLAFWQYYPTGFWLLLAACTIFSLGNSSDTFLILRSVGLTYAGNISIHTKAVFGCAIFAMFNVVFAATATPCGKLSDLLSRKAVILAGWGIYILVYAGFAFTSHAGTVWPLMAVYGLYWALTDGVMKAYVNDLVIASKRAGALGLFYTITGTSQLLASFMAGFAWDHFGVMWAMLLGVIFPLMAIPILLFVRQPETRLVQKCKCNVSLRYRSNLKSSKRS